MAAQRKNVEVGIKLKAPVLVARLRNYFLGLIEGKHLCTGPVALLRSDRLALMPGQALPVLSKDNSLKKISQQALT